MDLKFQLNQVVKIDASGESGKVVGRAEYAYAEPSYFIRMADANGKAIEAWWTESALTAA